MFYKYRNHSIKGVTAEQAHSEMERIRVQRGLTPENLVEESQKETAVLHPAFEWQDEKAAAEYRLIQGRNLIRSIEVINDEGQQPEAVYYHVIRSDEQGGNSYEPMEVLIQRPDELKIAIAGLQSRLLAAKDAVEALRRAAKRREVELPLLDRIVGRLDRSIAESERMTQA